MSWRPWGDHPLIVTISTIAALGAIVQLGAWFLQKQSIQVEPPDTSFDSDLVVVTVKEEKFAMLFDQNLSLSVKGVWYDDCCYNSSFNHEVGFAIGTPGYESLVEYGSEEFSTTYQSNDTYHIRVVHIQPANMLLFPFGDRAQVTFQISRSPIDAQPYPEEYPE